jgi:hypothetical protein
MNKMSNHRAEALRRLRLNQYEVTDRGEVLMPAMGITMAGHWETQQGDEPWQIDHNIVVNQGLLHILEVALNQGSAHSAFYIAPFSGAVTPAASLTAATFTATTTEFTNYDEATRVAWVSAAPAANAIGNTASPAVFTIASGGGTIRGAGLMSTSTKSATTGVLIAAARFGADKTMAEDEELRVKYILTATST